MHVLAVTEAHWAWTALGLLSIPFLVALNGLFVAAEFALVAVRRTRVEELVGQGVQGARSVEKAVGHLDHSIAASQLGITIASIALGWVGEPALVRLMEPWFASLPSAWGKAAVHTTATALALLLITFMHVVFGELIPKTMAIQTPDKMALWVARPLIIFGRLTRPLVLLMNGTGNLILRLCGYRPPSGEVMLHSVEELALLIEDIEQAGILEPEQAEVVQNVFLLADKKVSDCLVPRDKMTALELRCPPQHVLEVVSREAHTRMPVYDGDLDNIVGIVNTKDLFRLYSLQGTVAVQEALYPPLFLKPEQDLGDALNLFRRNRTHMALVRDENDKIQGLITLEDVLEELVGDIEDEQDWPLPTLTSWRRRLLHRLAARRAAKRPDKPAAPR